MIIRKQYLQQVEPFINQDLVKIFVGIRRSGKTVLLRQIRDLLLERGVSGQRVLLMNLESARYRRMALAGKLYDYITEQAQSAAGKLYIMLDEVQEIPEWQVLVNSLRVDFDCDIYLTGSNSTLFSGELATYLSGRYIRIKVYPFSLREAKELRQQQGKFHSDEQLFTDYLKYGGLPQRFYLPDNESVETYLEDVYEAVVMRDVISRHKVKDAALMKKVLDFVLDNVGNPFSARKISGLMTSQGAKITVPTILNYLQWFQEAFVLFAASRYDIIGKELLKTTEKYYAADLGLRNIAKSSERIDSSKLYENIVYLEMLARGYEVQVGKLQEQEIDFICRKGQEKIYLQVAYLINESDEVREFGNLENIADNYPKYVISGDLHDLSRNGIQHKNILRFLLDS